MNMLVLNPDEMQGDEWDERMEFYLQKTGSIDVEHLIHKVQLYVKARDEQRANDEFMCDLMSFVRPEDDEMLGEPDEMAGDGNEMEHGDGNEMAVAVPAPVVNSPAAAAPMDERAADEADPKEENEEMLPESESEVASMFPIKTNDEPPSPLVGPPPPADGSPPPNGLPPPKKTPDDDAARKGETVVETLAASFPEEPKITALSRFPSFRKIFTHVIVLERCRHALNI